MARPVYRREASKPATGSTLRAAYEPPRLTLLGISMDCWRIPAVPSVTRRSVALDRERSRISAEASIACGPDHQNCEIAFSVNRRRTLRPRSGSSSRRAAQPWCRTPTARRCGTRAAAAHHRLVDRLFPAGPIATAGLSSRSRWTPVLLLSPCTWACEKTAPQCLGTPGFLPGLIDSNATTPNSSYSARSQRPGLPFRSADTAS